MILQVTASLVQNIFLHNIMKLKLNASALPSKPVHGIIGIPLTIYFSYSLPLKMVHGTYIQLCRNMQKEPSDDVKCTLSIIINKLNN